MKHLALVACLAFAVCLSGGCSSGDTENSTSMPAYLQKPVELTNTLYVGQVSIGHPDDLSSSFDGSHEWVREDGLSFTCTQGSLFSEDRIISYFVEERIGMTLEQAREEVEDEMTLPERYEELDDATKIVVDHTEWLSLDETEEGFALTKIHDDTTLTIARYYGLPNGGVAIVSGSFPIEWHDASPDFFDLIFDSVEVDESAKRTWIPTEADPVYVDDSGTTWGYFYHPEGAPDYLRAFPDMLYTQSNDGQAGYLKMAEHKVAVEAARAQAPDEPGEYAIAVTSNLYGFLSNDIVGRSTTGLFATQPAEAPGESGNEWIPLDEGSVSTTSDGRTWGFWTADGSTDMEFVMATDTGRYGYIVAEKRLAAESENWNEYVSLGARNPVVMLDVYLYDSQEVIGRYAVTMRTEW